MVLGVLQSQRVDYMGDVSCHMAMALILTMAAGGLMLTMDQLSARRLERFTCIC